MIKSQPVTHELKILPKYYEQVKNGRKTFEFRRNDRNYKVGDIVILREWLINGHFYSGRQVKREITYILPSFDDKMHPEFIIFSIAKIKEKHKKMNINL